MQNSRTSILRHKQAPTDHSQSCFQSSTCILQPRTTTVTTTTIRYGCDSPVGLHVPEWQSLVVETSTPRLASLHPSPAGQVRESKQEQTLASAAGSSTTTETKGAKKNCFLGTAGEPNYERASGETIVCSNKGAPSAGDWIAKLRDGVCAWDAYCVLAECVEVAPAKLGLWRYSNKENENES